MPKVKYFVPPEPDYKTVGRTIKARWILLGITKRDLCERTGISERTLTSRLAHPEDFTAKELTRLGKALGVQFILTEGKMEVIA